MQIRVPSFQKTIHSGYTLNAVGGVHQWRCLPSGCIDKPPLYPHPPLLFPPSPIPPSIRSRRARVLYTIGRRSEVFRGRGWCGQDMQGVPAAFLTPIQDKTQDTTKTRKDQTRQDKKSHGKARQGKARQGKARQGKARQGKARQDKTRQDKTRQGKTKENIQQQDRKTGNDRKQEKSENKTHKRQEKDKTRQGKNVVNFSSRLCFQGKSANCFFGELALLYNNP
jgi:hypothetical protein